MKKNLINLLAVAAVVFSLFACEKKESAKLVDFEQPEYSKADSLIWEAFDAYDSTRVTFLIDSLQKTGELSEMGADLFRAEYYMAFLRWKAEYEPEAEPLFRRVMAHNSPADRRQWYYNYAGNQLALNLYMRHNYEGFLREAIPLLASMDSLGNGLYDQKINLYSLMGCSYVKLEQPEKARELSEKARSYAWDVLAVDSSPNIHQLFINSYARIKDAYVRVKDWEEVRKWMVFNDSIGNVFKRRHPDAPVWAIYDGYTHLDRAIKLWSLGQTDSAATEYAEFRKFPCAYTVNGFIQANDYLMNAARWADAADNYRALDWFIDKPYLEEISAYYFPKFRANYNAGRKDSALFVAHQISEMFDSAYVWNKRSQMAEMATVYDTQGKEMQIAKQQAELSQQRLWGTLAALVLLTAFFVIYTWYRRKAQQRLAVAHQELETAHTELKTAYDQLEETTAAKERIESELRIARDIQMSMVPGIFPEYVGLDMSASLTPAKEVGGDLYGYVIQGEYLYFCVGDVSGKGVPASLFMAQATRLFCTLSREGFSPEAIANRMNSSLCEGNDTMMFVTMFIGMLNLQTGHLDYCNCGHNPPVISGEFLKFKFKNRPIGILDVASFKGESIDDIRGQQVLIYTDGLNEAEGPKREQLGNERLLELMADTGSLTSREVIDMMKAAVEQHRAGAAPNDDLTLMCLKLSPKTEIRKNVK